MKFLKIPRVTLRKVNFVLFVIIVALMSIVLFAEVDVLVCPDNRRGECQGDFYIHVDDSKQYSIGDEIILTSEFVKKRSSNGLAKRYLECQNLDGQFSSRFPIGESNADQHPGLSTRDVVLRVPVGVQAPLPAVCRVVINIEYPINGLRDSLRGKHIENAWSNSFTIIEGEVPIVELHITVDNGVARIENAPVTIQGRAREVVPVTPNQTQPNNSPPVNNQNNENTPPDQPPQSILPGNQPPILGCIRKNICI